MLIAKVYERVYMKKLYLILLFIFIVNSTLPVYAANVVCSADSRMCYWNNPKCYKSTLISQADRVYFDTSKDAITAGYRLGSCRAVNLPMRTRRYTMLVCDQLTKKCYPSTSSSITPGMVTFKTRRDAITAGYNLR